MKEIIINNLDLEKFSNLIKEVDLGEIQILEISNDSIFCKAFPPKTKSIIKYVKEEFKFDAIDLGDKIIKIPIYKFSRFLSVVKIFGMSNIKTCTLKIDVEEDQENPAYLNGSKMVFEANKDMITVKNADPILVKHMPAEVLNMFCDVSKACVRFDLSQDIVKKLTEYIGIESDEASAVKDANQAIIIDIKEDGIIFSSKERGRWKFKLAKTDTNMEIDKSNVKLYLNKNVVSKLNGTLQTIYFVQKDETKYLIVSKISEDNVFITTLPVVEEDKKSKK